MNINFNKKALILTLIFFLSGIMPSSWSQETPSDKQLPQSNDVNNSIENISEDKVSIEDEAIIQKCLAIPFIFDDAWYFQNGQAPVMVNGKWGIIDKKGNYILKPEYEKLGYFSEGLVAFKEKDKWGFLNEAGTVIIKPLYDEVDKFKDGLVAVEVNKKWGYIDKKGDFVIKPILDWRYGFNSGLIQVKINNKWGYLNKEGKIAIPIQYDFTDGFKEGLANVGSRGVQYARLDLSISHCGLAPVKLNNKWGYINTKGKVVIPIIYDSAGYFNEGLANVTYNNQAVYINNKGEIVIKTSFQKGRPFFSGFAAVYDQDAKLWGYINKQGAVVVSPKFAYAFEFKGDFARVELPPHGLTATFINKKGQFLLEPTSAIFGDFCEDMAAIDKRENFGKGEIIRGYFNTRGKMVIEAKFKKALKFQQGVARVQDRNHLWGFIDKQGNYIIKPIFVEALDESEGLAAVKLKDKWGFISISCLKQ